MKCYGITTYCDGSHEPHFYILVEDDYALYHALTVIGKSPDVDWFSIDGEEGPEFFQQLEDKLYPQTSKPTAKEGK